MNVQELMYFLSSIFSEFTVHPDLHADLKLILSHGGAEKDLLSKLEYLLRLLQTCGPSVVGRVPGLEWLKGSDGMCAMRFRGTLNIRILFKFSPARLPIFLLAFIEEQGKRSTGYQQFIPPAQKRFEALIGGHLQ